MQLNLKNPAGFAPSERQDSMYLELHIVIFQRLLEGDVNSSNGQSCHILKLFFILIPPFLL